MRVLVLDDDDNRHNAFRHWLIGTVADHAHTAKEARAFLQGSRYDLVCLDHDLDINATLGRDPHDETGADVAEYIRLHLPLEKQPLLVLVHSVNPAGSWLIEQIIGEAGIPVVRVPFTSQLGMVMARLLRRLKT